MKKANQLRVIAIVVLVLGILGSGIYFFVTQINHNKIEKTTDTLAKKSFGWKYPVAKFPSTGSDGKLIAYSSIRDPGGIPQGLPVRLKIPEIGVDSAIEDAQITPDGRMDVPAGSVNVAWFSLGPHPGKVGSAVIGGHFGIENGKPFVFYQLDKVKIGDKIYIVNDKNDTLAFVVRAIKSFDRNADATTVFTSEDGLAHLNLITCEGVWNQVNGTYPQRLVVFTDAIPSEGGVAVNKSAAKEKAENNSTKTTPVPTQNITKTPEKSESIKTPESSKKDSSTFTQMLIASAQSLYASPLDGLITSLLLLSIFFVTFKIIKR